MDTLHTQFYHSNLPLWLTTPSYNYGFCNSVFGVSRTTDPGPDRVPALMISTDILSSL